MDTGGRISKPPLGGGDSQGVLGAKRSQKSGSSISMVCRLCFTPRGLPFADNLRRLPVRAEPYNTGCRISPVVHSVNLTSANNGSPTS